MFVLALDRSETRVPGKGFVWIRSAGAAFREFAPSDAAMPHVR